MTPNPTPPPASDLVPFLDADTGRVVRIPAAELRPGCVRAQVNGSEEIVWIDPAALHAGPVRHGPFPEEIRDYIRDIHAAFAEHRELSFEEWEDGFRRDANPEREIAIFSHAADVYRRFTADEPSPERRHDVYRLLVACMTASPETVWHVVELAALTRPEAERIARRFYGGEKAADAGDRD